VTDFRQSQALAEVWVAVNSSARISQVLFEAWVTRLPVATTALLVSQILAEAYATFPVTFVVSQAAVEVWTTTAVVPPWRRYGQSAQAV